VPLIKFVRNYNDLSTENGFQFEFFCDRCGSGYQPTFQSSATGLISGALQTASSLFGALSGAAAIGDRVHSATWEKAHDAAFARAVEEARPHFKQCRRCGQWVDEVCGNAGRNLWVEGAPDLGIEAAAAEAEAAAEDIQTAAREGKYEKKAKPGKKSGAVCPQCGAKAAGGRFCAECGAPLAQEKHCVQCGAKIKVGSKFCPECGARQG